MRHSCSSLWMVWTEAARRLRRRSVNATEECRNCGITDGRRIRRVYRRWPRRMRSARYSPCRPRGQSFSIIRESLVSAKVQRHPRQPDSPWGWSRWVFIRAKGPIAEATLWRNGRPLSDRGAVRGKSYNRGLWNTLRELMSRAARSRHVAVIFQHCSWLSTLPNGTSMSRLSPSLRH